MTENIYSSVEQTIPHDPPVVVQDVAEGSVTFEDLDITSLVPHSLPLSQVVGSTGLVMTATAADAVFAQLVSSNKRGLTTNLADNGTKTSTGLLQYQLPNNYVPGAPIQVSVASRLLCATGDTIASNNGSDVDCEVYKQSRTAGSVGSDLCATSAQTGFAADDTVYTKTFTITPTGLVPGDMLNIKVVCRAIEAGAEGGTIQQIVSDITVAHDEYGKAA